MSILKYSGLFLLAGVLISSCKNGLEKREKETDVAEVEKQKSDFSGSYVSADYAKRSEGFDWISVNVSTTVNNRFKIAVRSRADQKKPTCTFDAVADKVNETTYKTKIDDKNILFVFDDKKMVIKPENDAASGVLSFYCSGGATFAGVYERTNEPIDPKQLDQTQFSKVLNLQGVGFNVSSIQEGGNNQLTVFTFGLPNEYKETFDIGTETIADAEVEDLNADGSPELVVFTQKNDPLQKMKIYAFSVNNKKSVSQVYFQPTEENKQINSGYNGEDEFALVERNLVLRFPVFSEGKKTGKMRQVAYQLAEGEASRKFVVKSQHDN